MDHNGYPDIVIGSYQSNNAVVLRSRPVVHIIADMTSEPGQISHTTTQCPIDGHPYNCFKLKVCLRFTAEPTSE